MRVLWIGNSESGFAIASPHCGRRDKGMEREAQNGFAIVNPQCGGLPCHRIHSKQIRDSVAAGVNECLQIGPAKSDVGFCRKPA